MATPRAAVRWTWNGQTYSGMLPNYYGAINATTGIPTGSENAIGTALGMNVSAPGADDPPVAASFDTVREAIASGTLVRIVVRYTSGTKVKTARLFCPTDKVNELHKLPGSAISIPQYGKGTQIGTIQTSSGTIRTAKVLARTKVVY